MRTSQVQLKALVHSPFSLQNFCVTTVNGRHCLIVGLQVQTLSTRIVYAKDIAKKLVESAIETLSDSTGQNVPNN